MLLLKLHCLRKLRWQQQSVLNEDVRDTFTERFNTHDARRNEMVSDPTLYTEDRACEMA